MPPPVSACLGATIFPSSHRRKICFSLAWFDERPTCQPQCPHNRVSVNVARNTDSSESNIKGHHFILKESGPGSIVIFFPSPLHPDCQSFRPGTLLHSLYSLHASMSTLSTPRGRSALAVSTIFTSLATAVLLVRIYTRAVLVKQMGSDDYTILVALVGGLAE